MTAEELINDIERDCTSLSNEIIDKVCRRAIHEINVKTKLFPLVDGYPKSFTFFDILSCEVQSKTYDEIVFSGRLVEDFIDSELDAQYDKLSEIEKTILAYMDFTPDFGNDYEYCDPHKYFYSRFHELLNEHWANSKKIEHYNEKL